ncbi:MAG: ergothioneine biosynthesis protein EgtB [Leptospiraceae bacterium]|nr:ergothioneine biosynthesis protein EgtB [Leptospiraceae bacterium]
MPLKLPETASTSPAFSATSPKYDTYAHIRGYSELLTAPLSEADQQLQSMPDASPAKWHLAHTTWFFETMILAEHLPEYRRFNEHFNYLYNSYYNGIGRQYPRHRRGCISRPSAAEVLEYRRYVDEHMRRLFDRGLTAEQAEMIELGLHHEQQHQELILTDIKHALFQNPMYPAYMPATKQTIMLADEAFRHGDSMADTGQVQNSTDKQNAASNGSSGDGLQFVNIDSGLYEIGYADEDFSFDNERPRHRVYVHAFQLANRLITNGEYLEFMRSGGYQNPAYWLSDGWTWLQASDQKHPMYWVERDGEWFEFTMYGLQTLRPDGVLVHVNLYEAHAFASWYGARLPTEAEWEVAAQSEISSRAFERSLQANRLHPPNWSECNRSDARIHQLMDSVWQWTAGAYSPYPGFQPFKGNAGEYNGKFMANQFVLRGASCVTPASHRRVTYRNFFYAHQRWQFTGLRLAR